MKCLKRKQWKLDASMHDHTQNLLEAFKAKINIKGKQAVLIE